MMEANLAVSKLKINAAGDIAVATRISLERHPESGEWCEARFRLMRKANGKLYLAEEARKPGGREVVTTLSRKQAVNWLSYHPARGRGAAAAEHQRSKRLLADLTAI